MTVMFKRLWRYLRIHWRMILAITLGTAGVCFLMLFRLGSISGGLSGGEIRQVEFASSWRHIVNNPLNAPLTCVEWLILTLIPHHGNTVTRAASPIFGILALAAFAYVLRRWYGVRSAIYGTVIFGFCSWFLHVSRFASPSVLYLWAVPTLLAIMIAWDRYHTQRRTSYVAVAALAVLLYVPGMAWLVLAGLLLQPHVLVSAWRTARGPIWRGLLCVLPVIMLLPLIVAMVRTPSLLQTWLGLPQHFGTANSVARGLVHSISFFVYKGPDTPELWLIRTPILSFFATVMALLGVLFYGQHWRAPRTRLLFAYFAIGALLFALGGPVTISIIVPLVYLVIAAGFGYLLHEWLHVFPRNPLARAVGFGLMGLAVTLTCVYELRAYYVAWPHNPHTQAAFHQRP